MRCSREWVLLCSAPGGETPGNNVDRNIQKGLLPHLVVSQVLLLFSDYDGRLCRLHISKVFGVVSNVGVSKRWTTPAQIPGNEQRQYRVTKTCTLSKMEYIRASVESPGSTRPKPILTKQYPQNTPVSVMRTLL